MGKENKMYNFEIVDKAISIVAMGFSCDYNIFEKSLEVLPKEIQAAVLAAVFAGEMAIHMQMKKMAIAFLEVEKKAKEMKDPTKEDIDRLYQEVLNKISEIKQEFLKKLSYTSQLNKKVTAIIQLWWQVVTSYLIIYVREKTTIM